MGVDRPAVWPNKTRAAELCCATIPCPSQKYVFGVRPYTSAPCMSAKQHNPMLKAVEAESDPISTTSVIPLYSIGGITTRHPEKVEAVGFSTLHARTHTQKPVLAICTQQWKSTGLLGGWARRCRQAKWRDFNRRHHLIGWLVRLRPIKATLNIISRHTSFKDFIKSIVLSSCQSVHAGQD